MRELLGEIGTYEWCRATRGILSRRERVRYTTAVLLEIARLAPRLTAAKLGFVGSGVDPSVYVPPETELTRRVIEACAHLDPMIIEHSYRCYVFARALAEVDGLSCNHEALFAAAMFHDYVFTSMETIHDRCFTLPAAEKAAEVIAESTLSPALRHDVLDAITLHANPRVPRERGVLQHVFHAGVMVDVMGVRRWELDPHGFERVLERHPRLEFTKRGLPLLRMHGRLVPGSRSNAALRCGFALALQLSPWLSHERTAGTLPPPLTT